MTISRTYGVSFSVKQCRNFKLDSTETLNWLLDQGFRRFRLMSYWNETEKQPGQYDFTELDKQIAQITAQNGEISLCLGVRQPRWPENHWPDWAWNLPKNERDEKLINFTKAVAERYKDYDAIISFQLENEALLKAFGERSEVDRKRLRAQFKLVKNIVGNKPVIMTTSTSWGIPFRRPIPNIVGFSFYQIVYNKGAYHTSFHKPWLDRMRALIIRILWRKSSFIHELQLEPWGPKNIWEMDDAEQDKSMNVSQIRKNLTLAKQTELTPIDLWGGEWWYWRVQKHNDPTIWQAVQEAIT